MQKKRKTESKTGQQVLLSKYFSVGRVSTEQKPAAISLVSDDEDEVTRQSEKTSLETTKSPKEGEAERPTSNEIKTEPTYDLLAELERLDSEPLEAAEDEEDGQEKGGKLTPLELQWKALKESNPDVLLCVECGYKYRLFGEDADIASKILSLGAFKARSYLQTSFPVHRLNVHVRRLVEHGHKVGIVTQAETAALKKQSSTKNKLFQRELSRVYSRATFLQDGSLELVHQLSSNATSGDRESGGQTLLSKGWVTKAPRGEGEDEEEVVEETLEEQDNSDVLAEYRSNPIKLEESDIESERFVCFVWEVEPETGLPLASSIPGWTPDQQLPRLKEPQIAFLAVDVQSGTVLWDNVCDDEARTKLSAHLAFFRPLELVLIAPTMSWETEECIKEFGSNAAKPPSLERVFPAFDDPAKAMQTVRRFLEKFGSNSTVPYQLPRPVLAVFAAAVKYFSRYGLERVLLPDNGLAKIMGKEQDQTFMKIEETTLRNLDVISTSSSRAFSLSAFLTKRTLTPMGFRLVGRWLQQPLADCEQIRSRQEAVVEIISSSRTGLFSPLKQVLKDLKRFDLERASELLFHERSTPKQFVHFLEQVTSICCAMGKCSPNSIVLSSHFSGAYRVELLKDCEDILKSLDLQAAKENDVARMFTERERYSEVFEIRGEIDALQQGFTVELDNIREALQQPEISYRTLRTGVSSVLEYLIELPRTKHVPADWVEVSSTQRLARYVTPKVESLLEELARRREELSAATKDAWKRLQHQFAESCRTRIRELCRAVAVFDALQALASVGSLPGYCQPTLVENSQGALLFAKAARHPLIEANDISKDQVCVPNDICIGTGHPSLPEQIPRVVMVTGPNMGGKSTFVRTAAMCIILAQIGAFVPADSCTIAVFDSIIVRMGVQDDPLRGMSTFLVEMRQMADILNSSSSRSLCIADEVGRGTSTFDGQAIAKASLEYICHTLTCPCFFITHYSALSSLTETFPPKTLSAMHMAFLEIPEGDQTIAFLYKAVQGVAERSFGLNVARLAGIPSVVIEDAQNTDFAL